MANLYLDFLEAGRLIANITGMKNAKSENRKHETPKIGVDYLSYYSAKETKFNFFLRTECKGSDYSKWQTLDLSLYFYNDFDLCQLYGNKLFKYPERVDMKEWAAEMAQKYLSMKKGNDLNFLFGDRDIRVRGIAGVTNSTLIEFIIVLKGYLAWSADRLLVYRFHHGTGLDEKFSYAFFIESRHLIYDYSFWCVFPAFVGMTGGTGHGGYIQAESLLEEAKKKLKLKIIDVHVEEDKFLKYLHEKNVVFETIDDLLEQTMKYAGMDNQAKTFSQRLQKCIAGKKMWREYEDLVQGIFTYLFTPPLDEPKCQSRTIDGLDIRDLVFPNHVPDGFWEEIRNEYKGSYVVVEAKNREKPSKEDVMQIADYLNEKQLGLFGILVTRKLSKQALEKRREYYSNNRKMIVLFDDSDIQKMILKKANNEKPEDILIERIDSYRILYGF